MHCFRGGGFFFACWQHTADADPSGIYKLVVAVKISPSSAYETRTTIKYKSRDLQALLLQETAPADSGGRHRASDLYATIEKDGTAQAVYRIHLKDGTMVQEHTGGIYRIPGKLRKELQQEAEALRRKHYGNLMAWEKAQKLVPRKSVFTVIDIQTGMRFNVQRRAGSKHADVQPLTAQDSKIMKKIYGGEWSWRRKAILVQKDNRLIAASMNGMPHGGDGIPGNGFSGHFCIHFLGSTTHKSRQVDPDHQLMIYKAAGQLGAYFARAAPNELINAFIFAMNDKDPEMLKLLLAQNNEEQVDFFVREMQNITYIRKLSNLSRKEAPETLTMSVPLEVRLLQGRRSTPLRLEFLLSKGDLSLPWRIIRITNLRDRGDQKPK